MYATKALRNAAVAAARSVPRTPVTELAQYPKVGEKLHGFTLLRTKHVPELELIALHLQHDKTGADYLHIARDDSNNVFSIGFKTNPPDDTGVPHILEHTTLCGSEKYPIRDPFFKMLPRTLSNFMNAFTASDHTFYPFATTNTQDFQNLMSVYLDATLHPLLNKTDFTQEGWRIGPENPRVAEEANGTSPEDSKLVFKGVVYNEMKGQMSDAGYLFYIRFQDHMFPSINNSGGDPQKITDLTYDQLKMFHAEHYHPSNAKILTYGDMPLADHLREVGAQLSTFDKIKADVENKRPIDLSSGPRLVTVPGPVDPLADPDKQYKTSVSWVTGETTDAVESFSLSILEKLLMDGYGSPIYKGLIESGLGTDFSPNSGYDNSAITGLFSVGLTGVQEADVERLRPEVKKILEAVRANGFDRSKIDGYLHQLELSLKHKTANFGMGIVQRLKSKWFTGTDPFDTLAWNDVIQGFEEKMAKGGYLEALMDKYLLNDNTLTFTMIPSPTYGAELAEEEDARLASKIAEAAEKAGSEIESRKLFEQHELQLLQEQGKTMTEDLSCLPTVHVKDIPRSKDPVDLVHEKITNSQVQWRVAPTNGLTYFRAINKIENLPDELRLLVPLFSDAIMRLGTKSMTMEQIEDLIKLKTGGLSLGYSSTSSPIDAQGFSEGFALRGMALDRHVPIMLEILQKLVVETDFDSPEAPKQIRQLLEASADGVVNDIASAGHAYARRAAEAGLSKVGWASDQVAGLTQVQLITSLAGRPENDPYSDVIEKLKQIQQLALASPIFRVAVTCGADAMDANRSALEKFLASRNSIDWPPKSSEGFSRANIKAFYPLPYQVYYGGLALRTVPYIHIDSGPLQILAQLLTHKHLHHEIREKGGAYGGGAYSQALEGAFGFYSYRDPNPQNTLSIMRSAGQWAVDKQWSDRDLEEAKISVFQSVDAPRSVNTEGMDFFTAGIENEMRQARRERLLDVTKEKVRDVAQKYVVDALAEEKGSVVFLGKQEEWVDDKWEIRELNVKAGAEAPPSA